MVACDNQSTEEPIQNEEVEVEEPAADDSSTDESEVSEPESEEDESEATDESSNDQYVAINETFADDDILTGELVEIEFLSDEFYDEDDELFKYDRYELRLEIENHSDETLEMEAREVSINDRMVGEGIFYNGYIVSPGKSAQVIFELGDISQTDGIELPPLENNFEMVLRLHTEDYETIGEYPISVNLD